MPLPTATLLVLLAGATLATDDYPLPLAPDANTSVITPETRQNPFNSPQLSVSSSEGLTVCPQEIQVDFNEQRIPKRLENVVCKERPARCSTVGQYRCTQLYTQIEVAHLKEDKIVRQTLEVKYGCICATRRGYDLHPAGKPPLVD